VIVLAPLVLALAAAASLTLPWLSQLEVENATRIWTTAPRRAYAKLDNAASLNPLSDESYLLAGSIALRFDDLARADHEFALALKRDHNDVYATLERGAIASQLGRRGEALRLLTRALALNPRNEVIQKSLSFVRKGERLSVEELNEVILSKARQLA
jgi:tetratricopeptide (TPR) repeat protein